MDDQRIGLIARAIRRKLGWRQRDIAERAGLSQAMVSLFERGRLEEISLGTNRRIAAAYEMRLELLARWRGRDVDRLMDERHAAMVEAVMIFNVKYGWPARAEVTFSIYGDRGSIDVFAWNEAERAVLIQEIKSDLVAIEGTVRPLAVKRRLAAEIAFRELGWRPRSIGTVLVLPEGSHVRNRVARHAATFDSILPDRLPQLRRWLRKPSGPIGAIWFLSLSDEVVATLRPARRIRLRQPRRLPLSDGGVQKEALGPKAAPDQAPGPESAA